MVINLFFKCIEPSRGLATALHRKCLLTSVAVVLPGDGLRHRPAHRGPAQQRGGEHRPGVLR